jgi:uncharacterized protein YjbI with pentapeptide repeats
LVSANAASFVAAMKNFGPTQTMLVTEHPSLLRFWEWSQRYPPNREPMLHWAQWRLGLCSKESKDCSLVGGTRLDLSGANLNGADLNGADLNSANINKPTDLRWTDLSNANLRDADLRGALLEGADLGLAKYSANTKFPPSFDPKAPRLPPMFLVPTADRPAKGGWFAWLP